MLFCLSNKSTGQQKQEHADFIGFKPAAGFIVPHSRDVVDVSGAIPFGAELEAGRWFSGKLDGSPGDVSMKRGVALTHMNFDFPEVLGSATSLTVFAEPVLNEKGWFHVSLRAGAGLSYHSKMYDQSENPRNLFISTRLNLLTYFGILITYHLSENWYLTSFAKYNHISNIGLGEPNKGLNYPVFGIGGAYTFQEIDYMPVSQPGAAGLRHWRIGVNAFASLHKQNNSDTYKNAKPAMGILIETRKPLSRINGISLGVEAGANYQLKQELAQQNESIDHKIIALLAGHDFYTGRFVFSQYLGWYAYAPYYSEPYQDKVVYQRYSFAYRIADEITVGTTLRAHGLNSLNFNLMVRYNLQLSEEGN